MSEVNKEQVKAEEPKTKKKEIPPALLVHKMREDAILPVRMTSGSAGYDLATPKAFSIEPGEVIVIPTGLVVKIPEGYCGVLRIRSSMFKNHGLHVFGSGLIDSDYCGPEDEIMVSLIRMDVAKKVELNKPGSYVLERIFDVPDGPRNRSVFLTKVNKNPVVIPAGTRIAQLVLLPYGAFDVREFKPGDESRGGFGSTGTK